MTDVKPYQLTIKELTDDKELLDENRRCLLTSYHASVQTHAGYLIALIIGTLTLFSRWDSFFSLGDHVVPIWTPILFTFIVATIFGVGLWLVLRIGYWTVYSTSALGISMSQIVTHFNDQNRNEPFPYTEKPPYLNAIQSAITNYLTTCGTDWYRELAFNTGHLFSRRNIWLFLVTFGFFIVLLAIVLLIVL